MRISRPCYDKYWRCPGWAGGGWKFAKVNRCPTGASLARVIDWEKRWMWHWQQCPECKVWVMPYVFTNFAPSKIWWRMKWWVRDRIYAWKLRKGR